MAHPRKFDDKDPRLKRVRKLCLDLPDTFEKEAWGECTFRVDGGTIFAMTDWNHHGSGHTALWEPIAEPPARSRATSSRAIRNVTSCHPTWAPKAGSARDSMQRPTGRMYSVW